MELSLLEKLTCPVCGGGLRLEQGAEVRSVAYRDGDREEVEAGTAVCECGRRYPVEDYVLSLAGLFPPELQREAAYWDRYYLWLIEQGSLGFHDLRLGQAPYITLGVAEPFPASDTLDRYTVHHRLAEHPMVRSGSRVLDLGVGLGWTSLYLARAGYEVTAVEPSLGPVQAAKRHAISEGVFVEYVCGAVGHLAFRPGSFDTVTAFHSLHHVPNLEVELGNVSRWLAPGGTLALDEHVGNSKLAAALGGEVHRWAEEEVFPRYHTVPPEALAALPQEPHSEMEDRSVGEIVPLVSRMFRVEVAEPRHVFLDHFPLLYYLHTGRDLEAFKHALDISNRLQEHVRRVDPEGGDYMMIVAENVGGGQRTGNEGPAPEDQEPGPEPAAAPTPAEESAPTSGEDAELRAILSEQAEWARGLETELARKNREIERLEKQIGRIEGGCVMRLLRRFRGRGSRET